MAWQSESTCSHPAAVLLPVSLLGILPSLLPTALSSGGPGWSRSLGCLLPFIFIIIIIISAPPFIVLKRPPSILNGQIVDCERPL